MNLKLDPQRIILLFLFGLALCLVAITAPEQTFMVPLVAFLGSGCCTISIMAGVIYLASRNKDDGDDDE